MQRWIEKADVLIEALPYIRQFEVITKLNEACGAVARPPFIVEFGHKGLGGHFWLMVVQLSAEDGNGRLCQSSYLNQWAQANTMPLVLMGDFAYDWRLSGDEHDAGYDLLAEADRLHWVRPEPPAATRCDGTAIADFVFTGGKARAWKAHARVLGEADCGGRPGHRPVEAVFAF